MKILMCSLLLSCFAASSATARDSIDKFRDRLHSCSQLVIIEGLIIDGRIVSDL